MYSEVYLRPDDQHANFKSGYNEAVDVWSVGCLAGTLLTNAFLFPRDRTGHSHNSAHDDTADLTVAFNLKFLDTSEDWQGASRKCKSFIRGCAMVDNSQRLTVAQALQHPWVAHPSFVAEMHAEYARAIADWTPRASPKDLIEYLRPALPNKEALESGYEARLQQEVRSHHFSSPTATVPGPFRTLNTFIGPSKLHQVRLSPIDDPNTGPRRPKTPLDPPSNAGSTTLTISDTNTHHEHNDMSYLSIQDYAPPVMYAASVTDTQECQFQSGWGMKLAESMDLNRQTVARNNTLPREKLRV